MSSVDAALAHPSVGGGSFSFYIALIKKSQMNNTTDCHGQCYCMSLSNLVT